jgi:hypothetical protein
MWSYWPMWYTCFVPERNRELLSRTSGARGSTRDTERTKGAIDGYTKT